jgi:hypothetical protein
MTAEAKAHNESTADGLVTPAPAAPTTASARRPYKAPHVRHLGSVRELTLGGSNGPCVDGGGTRAMGIIDPGNGMLICP